MKYIIFLLLFLFCLTHSSDPERSSKRSSEPDPRIAELFQYLFKSAAPREVEHVVKRKLGESGQFEESMRRISSSSSDSADEDSDADMRRMVMDAVHEALEETKLQAADAQMQLGIKEQEVRQERYKFLLGCAGTVTTGLGLIGTIIAYNTSGC